jgi:uncharacterized metal-binding protein
MAEKGCECESTNVLLFPCSGASNVGQIANAAAVVLTCQGRGKMYCLAGIGAHISGMVDSAAHADGCIAIDGCAVACVSKALKHAGIHLTKEVIVTELGIRKTHEYEWTEHEVRQVMEAAAEGVFAAGASGESSCGCGCGCAS